VANLEAPIESNSRIKKVGPVKSTSEKGIESLASMGFDTVTLANNHAMDYGNAGLQSAKKTCANVELDTVGTGANQRSAIEPIYKQVKNSSIALFNACHEEFGIATSDKSGTAWIGDRRLPNKIEEVAETVDLTFLVAHGGTEFTPIPPISWQERLRELAESGMDAIIGHHPHVAQGWEIHQGVPIFYSLGNFLFHMPTRPSTRWGYGVEIYLKDSGIDKCRIVLTEEDDLTVREITSDRNRTKKRNHLLKVSDITSNSPSNRGYWQEICAQIFDQRYRPSLEDYGNGHFTALGTTPIREIDRLTRGVLNQNKMVEEQERIFYHFIKNESHRDVIQTALGLNSGAITDYRSPEIRSEVQKLLAETDNQFQEDRFDIFRRYMNTIIERIK